MQLLPDPRLDYKPTSNAVFRDGNLLDELRSIRRYHASPSNQAIHILSTALFFAFLATTLVLVFRFFTVPLPMLVFLVIVFFPVPYLGFYGYLDPVISIFWLPVFAVAVFGSIFIAEVLKDLMPLYAAIPLSFAIAWLALLPQLIGHLLLEKERSPSLEIFELTVMTPFFLGYCGVGWISCWHVRKKTTEKIWREDSNSPGDLDGKDLER